MAESEKFLILGQHPSIVKFLYGLIEITIMALDENLNYLPNKEDSEEWIIDSGFSSADGAAQWLAAQRCGQS